MLNFTVKITLTSEGVSRKKEVFEHIYSFVNTMRQLNIDDTGILFNRLIDLEKILNDIVVFPSAIKHNEEKSYF